MSTWSEAVAHMQAHPRNVAVHGRMYRMQGSYVQLKLTDGVPRWRPACPDAFLVSSDAWVLTTDGAPCR